MDAIGQLEILRRYPVKSMMGEDIDSAHLAFSGLQGDRVWGFVNPEKQGNFPWHSAREQHDLLLYRPRFIEAQPADVHYPNASRFAIEVETPEGQRFRVDDPKFLKLLQEHAKAKFELRFSEKGMHDARPISIFGLSTVAKLAEETGRAVDHRRFRANIYARWNDPAAFYEDDLVGKTLRIGDNVELLVVKKDPRCVIITLDPETAEADPGVLRNVAKNHKGCAGVYAVVVKEGTVRRGDTISLL